jgi:hypothetical protein
MISAMPFSLHLLCFYPFRRWRVLRARVVLNSLRTELFANFSEKARVCQVRSFFLSSRTVRGVCLPIMPWHNKQYNVYIFKKTHFFFFDLVRSAYFSRKFCEPLAKLFLNFFPNCSVRKCLSSSLVRFEDFQKCTPLVLGRARINCVRTSTSLLASEAKTRPSQTRVRVLIGQKKTRY